MENKTLKKFIEKFNLEEKGFYDITNYEDGNGFSAKKFLNKYDKNVSMLSVYLDENIKENTKRLWISFCYGEPYKGGVRIRHKFKLNYPIDIDSYDDYFYDHLKKKFYKKSKEISPEKIINEVYFDHIKTTKFFKGFFIRKKLLFWRVVLPWVFKILSKIFSLILYCISGDEYSFDNAKNDIFTERFFPKEEYEHVKKQQKENELKPEEDEKSRSIKIFENEIRYWSVMFYVTLHLLGYLFFMHMNYKPEILVNIFENNFLTLVYAILTLGIVEKLIPKIMRWLIKYFAKTSNNCLDKRLKV